MESWRIYDLRLWRLIFLLELHRSSDNWIYAGLWRAHTESCLLDCAHLRSVFPVQIFTICDVSKPVLFWIKTKPLQITETAMGAGEHCMCHPRLSCSLPFALSSVRRRKGVNRASGTHHGIVSDLKGMQAPWKRGLSFQTWGQAREEARAEQGWPLQELAVPGLAGHFYVPF